MDDPLGDSLVVEMEDLLPQDEVFQQHRATLAALQLVLVVGDADALVRRQVVCGLVVGVLGNVLVGLTAVAAVGLEVGLVGHGQRFL